MSSWSKGGLGPFPQVRQPQCQWDSLVQMGLTFRGHRTKEAQVGLGSTISQQIHYLCPSPSLNLPPHNPAIPPTAPYIKCWAPIELLAPIEELSVKCGLALTPSPIYKFVAFTACLHFICHSFSKKSWDNHVLNCYLLYTLIAIHLPLESMGNVSIIVVHVYTYCY